jgi:hypothetical protein
MRGTACESIKTPFYHSMQSSSHHQGHEDPSQLGATDQIEQLAADIARKQNRTSVTAKDREQALAQMRSTSPPAHVSKKQSQ